MGRYDHLTGRKCDDPKCNGDLKDTIIHFEESLPLGRWQCTFLLHISPSRNNIADTLDASYQHAAKADLCLVYGSSLTVTPAAEIPEVCC